MFCQQVLVDLIHDLSQPLGNIETSAYCLERALDTASPRAQEHLRLIRHQVEQARVMLVAATAELARARASRIDSVDPVAEFAMTAAASH
jgi:signal transduction histidine kinase